MSRIIPSNNNDFREWINTRSAAWTENSAAVGITTLQATQMATQATAMDDVWGELEKAKNAYEVARNNWNATKEATYDLGNENVRRIKTFAANSTDPANVYTLSLIPAPKSPVSNVPPGACTNVVAALDTVTGKLTLRWKCNNPKTATGTVYNIQRRVGTSGTWSLMGVISNKKFIDNAPPTAAVVQYQITAQRGLLLGQPSGPVSVLFGVGSSGETVITAVKMAA